MDRKTLSFGLLALLATQALQAQDIIVTNDLRIIEAHRLEIGESRLFYSESPSSDAAFVSIMKSDVLVLRRSDGTKMLFDDAAPQPQQASQPAEEPQMAPPLAVEEEKEVTPQSQTVKVSPTPATSNKVFLLKPGSKVYVYVNPDNSCEAVVQRMIVSCIKEQGLWTLVSSPDQAQFQIGYRLNVSGNGRGIMAIEATDATSSGSLTKNRKGYVVIGSEMVDEHSVLDNSTFGRKYCNKLESLIQDIQEGNTSELLSSAREFLTY